MWAMEEGALNKLQARYLLEMKENFVNMKAEHFNLDVFDDELTNGHIEGEVGILNIHGTISQFHDIFMQFFGGVGLDRLTEDFESLEKNPAVSTIVLDIQSGGGSIFGVQKFTELVRNSKKATITITPNIMASAAFYIGSAADKIFVTDDMTHVGSVGVLIEHFDTTGLEELTGVKKIPITAGSLKKADAASKQLNETELNYLKKRADDLHQIFIDDVAINLNKTSEEVREKFGTAKIFLGKEAIEEGFVDGKTTLNKIVEEINGSIIDLKEDILNIDFSELEGETLNMKLADVTMESLKEGNEDLYNEIFEKGVESVEIEATEEIKDENVGSAGLNEGGAGGITQADVNAAVSAAMAAHTARLEDIDALGIVGYDDLVKEAKKDPNKNAGTLAVAVLKAQGVKKEKAKTDMNADIEDHVDGCENNGEAKADVLTEEQFNGSEMNAKFTSYGSYKAYVDNVKKGNVKCFKNKV